MKFYNEKVAKYFSRQFPRLQKIMRELVRLTMHVLTRSRAVTYK